MVTGQASGANTQALAQEFVQFAVDSGVLRFGEFKTKAGRMSPYFFNAGLFDDGAKLGRLAQFYARRLLASGIAFDMIFGPAYKGIPLAAAVAIELARLGRNVPFAYNRKEAKDHGATAVGLSGFDGGRLAKESDISIHVQTEIGDYATAEDSHSVICHAVSLELRKLGEQLLDVALVSCKVVLEFIEHFAAIRGDLLLHGVVEQMADEGAMTRRIVRNIIDNVPRPDRKSVV